VHKLFRIIAVAAAIGVPSGLMGQPLTDQVNFKSGTMGGVHLYNVSVYSGYVSSAYPLTAGIASTPIPGTGTLGPDTNYGAQATAGWQRHGQRTNFSLMYSGGYNGMARYTDLSAFNQTLSISLTRQLRPKWMFTVAASGQDSTLAQFLYQPSSLSVVAQLPATFDDLAAAFSIGQFSNSQMASMLTGAPLLESPVRSALLGNRVLSYGLQASVRYAYSSRLSFSFGSFSAGGQNRRSGNNEAVQQPYGFIVPRTLGINAGLGMSYSLSPRTDLGVDAQEMRIANQYQNGYTTTATASFGRKMGTHWFLRVSGGGSLARVTQQIYGTPETHSVVGGGSIGFRTYQHTLIASYDRTSSTAFGFAMGINTLTSGSWNWHRPGSGWSLFTSAGQQQVRRTGYLDLSGWQASTGLSRRISTSTTVVAQYSYLSSNGTALLGGGLANLCIHSVRVSLNWAPETVLH